jgi:hypothetical protein
MSNSNEQKRIKEQSSCFEEQSFFSLMQRLLIARKKYGILVKSYVLEPKYVHDTLGVENKRTNKLINTTRYDCKNLTQKVIYIIIKTPKYHFKF